MYRGKKVAVVVPAYNEELLIGRVLSTMPGFVDRIIVVNDNSSDKTADVVRSHRAFESGQIVLLHHEANLGVGAAIVTGYRRAVEIGMDAVAVMAGDAQMDPADLPRLLDPIAEGEADYVKGNRLFRGESWELIPRVRYLGNAFLSLLTKIASGYWHVADSQSGYTAITATALRRIDLDRIYTRYGMPNDILIRLNVANFRVRDVSVRPIYHIGEKSGIRLHSVVPRIAWLLLRGFFWRLTEKYVVRDFHPLLFFYLMGLTLTPVGLGLGIWAVIHRILVGPISPTTAIFAAFLFISGCQSLFFAMWFDLDYNKHLR
ncbi:MAG: glycosyltransferase family 2 protein [Myxococcota bacterium]